MKKKKKVLPVSGGEESLPTVGCSIWCEFQKFSPVYLKEFHRLSRKGRAPQPIKVSPKRVLYNNRELHRFVADPENYRVPDYVS